MERGGGRGGGGGSNRRTGYEQEEATGNRSYVPYRTATGFFNKGRGVCEREGRKGGDRDRGSADDVSE
jgi:hypothetical protein